MASIGATATIKGDDGTTEGRARRLHTEILADIASRGIKIRSTIHGSGYLWSGNITTMASRCWPTLTITTGRTGPVSKQFIEVVKRHLAANKNLLWVQERGQFYVSPDYKESRVKKTATKAVPKKAAPTLAQESITDRAKRIWERAQQSCEASNAPTEIYKNVEFWVCDKPLAFWIRAEFPELCLPAMETQPNFEKYKRPLYDLLRATTNAVNIGSKYDESMKDGEHHWLIRKEWHDSHEAFENVFHVEPEVEPVPEPTLVVESVEVVNEIAPIVQDLPTYALEILSALVKTHEDLNNVYVDTCTENEMLESENARLTKENEALQVGIEEAKSGDTVIQMIEEVLGNIYEGTIGISRAIADVEDIIRVAKSDGS